MSTPNPAPFFRLWEALGWSPAQHERFHRALYSAGPDCDRVTRLIVDAVGLADADEVDQRAVLAVLASDWNLARNLAALASCCTGDPRHDEIQAAVIARAAELGLTAYAIAQRAGGRVSEDHVRAYLTRAKSMGSHKLQHVLRVLGLTVTPERPTELGQP